MLLQLCRSLISLGAAIAPACCRADWAREWRAELWHEADRLSPPGHGTPAERLHLVFRCAGAVLHAAWLRKEEWSLSVLSQDVRYAVRTLAARPGFTSIAVLTLALGIGANTAVFTVLRAVVLKPLPYAEPERLVLIWETNPNMGWTQATVAPANLLDWKARNRSFTDIAFYMGSDSKRPGLANATLAGSGEPERIRTLQVSSNLFELLGVGPALGRVFAAADSRPGTAVVLLSDGFWRRRFGADPGVVGRRLELNGAPYEVAGVLPRGFHVPGVAPDLFAPIRVDEAQARQQRRPHFYRAVARLAPGVTIEQARGDMTRIAAELEREYPDTNTKMGVGLGPLHEWFVGDVRPALLALMGAVALVLLVACANVGSLLLARATARQREIAIRSALGAGRLRLLRQLLVESLLLAGAGAAAGLALGYAALAFLRRVELAGVPRLEQVRIDSSVILFVALVAGATGLVFGLAPAWRSARAPGAAGLRDGSRGATSGSTRVRRVLIVAEVALSVLLLVGAGLMLRSFARLQAVDPGIDTAHAVSFRVSLPARRYDTDAKVSAFFTALVERLRAQEGVQAAGATVRLALEGYNWTGDLFIESLPDIWGRDLRHKAITPGYLSAAGLRLVRGRDFTGADTETSPPVVLVNQTLAQKFLGDRDPIGQRIAFRRPSAQTTWRTIVGVVADEKQDALTATAQPEVYEPHTQDAANTMAVVVRSDHPPDRVSPIVRRELAAADPALAIYDVRTLEEVVGRSLAEERFTMQMLAAFAVVAMLLAAVGLYGLIAFTVSERTREIGVRLALGATRDGVVRMVVSDSLRVVAIGVVAGLAAAAAAGGLAQQFLFQTAPTDPAVLASVAGLFAVVALAASAAPALRAAHTDPAVSLRAD